MGLIEEERLRAEIEDQNAVERREDHVAFFLACMVAGLMGVFFWIGIFTAFGWVLHWMGV